MDARRLRDATASLSAIHALMTPEQHDTRADFKENLDGDDATRDRNDAIVTDLIGATDSAGIDQLGDHADVAVTDPIGATDSCCAEQHSCCTEQRIGWWAGECRGDCVGIWQQNNALCPKQ